MIQEDRRFSNLKVDDILVASEGVFKGIQSGFAEVGVLTQGVGSGATLDVIYHGDTDELVFQVATADGTIKYARLPLNMGPPLFGTFPDPCVRTLSVQTVPTGMANLLGIRPIKGINYQPAPSDYTTNMPVPPQYFDTDFYNSDFEGLWGGTLVTGGGTPCAVSAARDDLNRFHDDLDLNFIRFFNLDREDFRNHVPFLDACQTNQIHVMIPLDFWVQQVDGPNWDTFRPLVITLITTLGPHPSVVAWQLGNELNGATNAGKIATIFALLVQHDAAKKPVTSGLQLGFFPSMAELIKSAIVGKGLDTDYTNRWFQAVNIYPPQADPVTDALVNLQQVVNVDWPASEFKDQPFLVSEYGVALNTTEAVQAMSIEAQARWIGNVNNPLFLGGCVFEFSNELWKVPPDTPNLQSELGLVKFSGGFCTALEPSNSSVYRVDALTLKPSYASFKSVVNP